jgi:nitroreductase
MMKDVTGEVAAHRHPEHEIHPVFLNRWSPRSFSQKTVPDEELFALFEAARWAPSGNNQQPWRYIIARTAEDRAKFHSFINPGNRVWCEKAPVLAVVLSKNTNHEGRPIRSHAFDAGASWAFLSLEATRRGLITHAMGGFDRNKAREILRVPEEEYELHVVIAIGYRGDIDALPPDLRQREKPSGRRPLNETVFEGEFGQPV